MDTREEDLKLALIETAHHLVGVLVGPILQNQLVFQEVLGEVWSQFLGKLFGFG